MIVMHGGSLGISPVRELPYQAFRDAKRPGGHGNEIAQRHRGRSTLTKLSTEVPTRDMRPELAAMPREGRSSARLGRSSRDFD